MDRFEALFFQKTPPPRWAFLEKAIQALGRKPLVAAETGVSSDYCNGLSTVFWESRVEIEKAFSIDLSRSALDSIERKVGRLEKISFSAAHSVFGLSALPNQSIDVLYLDSDLDPELMLHEACAGLPKLRIPGMLIADDADTKAPLLTRFLRGERIACKWPPYGGWKGRLDALIEQAHPPGTFGMLSAMITRFDGFEAVP